MQGYLIVARQIDSTRWSGEPVRVKWPKKGHMDRNSPMTDPLRSKENEERSENRRSEEKQESPPGLSFSELMPREAHAEAAKAHLDSEKLDTQAKDSAGIVPQDLSGLSKPAFTYYLGQKPQFQLRKSDFLKNIEKPLTEVKPLVDDFLKQTPEREDILLTPAEQNELSHSRDSLSRVSSSGDALSKALHLARLYQHLRYIEEAKKATDLSLGIDPDNHLGKELFKELERMHPPDIAVTTYPQPVASNLTKSLLRRRIFSLSGGRVIVLGDLLIDELVEGKPERISREAPVLILEHVDTELIPGGAANTANNIASLGGACHAIGVTGRDEYAGKLIDLFEKAKITHSLIQDPTRPTTVKTRILSKSHSLRQQLLRLDRISREPISPLIEGLLVEKLKDASSQFKAVVLSDYRGGVITAQIIRAVKALAAEQPLMVIVDAQDHFERFQDVTLMTPNQPDTEQMIGFSITNHETLTKAGEEILLLTGSQAILVTRGAEGMVLFQKGEAMIELPAFNKSEVFDVTGAGDTVVATMALALVTGSTFLEAMALGNLAAGIVVRKQGTAVTNQKEMLEQLNQINLSE